MESREKKRIEHVMREKENKIENKLERKRRNVENVFVFKAYIIKGVIKKGMVVREVSI